MIAQIALSPSMRFLQKEKMMRKNCVSCKAAPSGGSAVKMNTTTHHCSNTNWEWMMFLKDQRTTNGELMHCKNMSPMTCHKHLSSTKSFSICILSQKTQRISWKVHNKWCVQSKVVMWLEPLNKQRSSPVAFSSKKASCQKVMQTFLNALKFISSEKFHIHCNLFLSLLECKNDSKWGIPHTWPTLMHSAKMCDTNRWLLFVHHCVDLQSHVLVIHAESHLRHQWSPTTNALHTAWHCGGSSWSRSILESREQKTQSSLIRLDTSYVAASLLPFCLTFWSLSGGIGFPVIVIVLQFCTPIVMHDWWSIVMVANQQLLHIIDFWSSI